MLTPRFLFRQQTATWILALFTVAWLTVVVGRSGLSADKPNVLFLLSDDQRPDTVAAAGNPHIKTPSLDRLAKEGVRFTRATCSNPICTPSRAEIMSGCDGFRSGVTDFGGRFHEGLAFWPAVMRDAGYRTVYVGKWHLRGRPNDYGFESVNALYSGGGGRFWKPQDDWKGFPITGYRGWIFQSMDGRERYPELGVGLTPDISTRFADAAIEEIRRESERPFFVQVNFTAPHDPLLAPPGYENAYTGDDRPPSPANFLSQHPFDHGNFFGRDERLMHWPRTVDAVREELAMYYRVVSHLDAAVGKVLDALEKSGKSDNTLVIYSSDHGLAVGSHGLRGKQNMYEHTIGVPLLIRGPGIDPARQSNAQVYLRELFPTVCDWCGIAVPDSVQGKSFANVLRNETDQAHPYIFGYFRNSQRMIRGDRYKLIVYPEVSRIQLFDLQEDPFETKNLFTQHREIAEPLLERLQRWRTAAGE